MPRWLEITCEPSTVGRGLKFAVVVGSVLITINHGDALLAGDVDGVRWLKMALTVTVPYLVSTFSTVGARLDYEAERDPTKGPDEAR